MGVCEEIGFPLKYFVSKDGEKKDSVLSRSNVLKKEVMG